MPTTYKKLGDRVWGIRSTEPLQPGQTVTVTKVDMTQNQEVVDQIVSVKDGITIATVVKKERPKYLSNRDPRYNRRTGCICGSIEGYPQEGDCSRCRHDA